MDVFKFIKYQIYHVSEQELRNTFNYLRILEVLVLCTMYMFYIWSGHNLLIVIIGPRMQIRNTQQMLLVRRVLKGLKPL